MGLDDKTYGFTKADALELVGMIGNRERIHIKRRPSGGGGGGGGSSQIIEFTFSALDYAEEVPINCVDRAAGDAMSGTVTRVRCGGSMPVPGQQEDGTVDLTDPMGILNERDYRDLPGRVGLAVLMAGDEEYGYDGPCIWVIVYVDFYRPRLVVVDVIFETNQIRIKREKLWVWDNCELDDEVIVGTECPQPGYQ